jgi:membrane protein
MLQSRETLLQPTQLWKFLKDTFAAWSRDKVPRHGAALAYYTVLSLVPLLVVIIAMIGLIFGREAAQGYILEQIGSLVGPQSAEAIKEMIQRASHPPGLWQRWWPRSRCWLERRASLLNCKIR